MSTNPTSGNNRSARPTRSVCGRVPTFELRLRRRLLCPRSRLVHGIRFARGTALARIKGIAMVEWRRLLGGFLVSIFLVVSLCAQSGKSSSVSTRIDVQPTQLVSAPASANWVSYNGDYTGRRYSALREINTSNVAQLRAQWVFHAPNSDRLEVTPVVVDGIMFVTSANDAYALDAQTGLILWHYSRPIS